MDQRDSFDQVADLYAEVRRGYPTELFDDLAALGVLGPTADVLEVGCGAGQATGELSARARHVTALDPGAQLIDQARRKTKAGDLDFVVSSFEAWDAPPARFDLLASAQAWHWVDPAIGFAKAARTLRPGGAIALFGHVPLAPTGAVGEAFKAIYDRHLPGAWGTPPPQAWYMPEGPVAGLIEGSGVFGPAVHRGYAWTWRLDPRTFGRYLRTDSSYHVLPETPRFVLFDALSDAVERLGGAFDSQWETHLYVARTA